MSLNDNNSDFRIFWDFKVLKCFSVNMIISYKKKNPCHQMTGIPKFIQYSEGTNYFSSYFSPSMSAFSLAKTSRSPRVVLAATLLIAGAASFLAAFFLAAGFGSSLTSSKVRE